MHHACTFAYRIITLQLNDILIQFSSILYLITKRFDRWNILKSLRKWFENTIWFMKKVKSWMWKTCDCVVLQIHTLPNWSSLSICFWYLCLLSYPKRCPLNLFKLVSMSRVLTGAVSDKKTWFLILYHAKCSLGILHKTTNLMSLHEWLYTFNLNYYQWFSWNYSM